MENKKRRVLDESSGMMHIDNNFEDSYKRTKENELECFPKCRGEHLTGRHFCRTAVELRSDSENLVNSSPLMVFGEIHKCSNDASFVIGDLVDIDLNDNGCFFHAQVFSSDEKMTKFVIYPTNWKIGDSIDDGDDTFVMTSYLVIDEKVVDIVNSVVFRIRPSSSTNIVFKQNSCGISQPPSFRRCQNEKFLVGFHPVSSPSHIAEHCNRVRPSRSRYSQFRPIHSRAPQSKQQDTLGTPQLDVKLKHLQINSSDKGI
jgi:hypothetical protein